MKLMKQKMDSVEEECLKMLLKCIFVYHSVMDGWTVKKSPETGGLEFTKDN